jgi:hypothetical protein
MDIHGLLADVYQGLSRTRWLNRERGVGGFFSALFDRARYGLLGWYHDVVYRRAAMRSADAYYREGSTLNAYWTYRVAYERRPQIALEYLSKARRFETEIIPESEPFYELHEGVLREEPALIAEARRELDPVWERSEIALALREELSLLDPRGNPRLYAERAAQLLLMNAGAFQQHGLTLPVSIAVDDAFGAGEVRWLRKALERRGFEAAEGGEIELVLSTEEGPAGRTVTVRLLVSGTELRRFRYGLGASSREAFDGLAATIAGTIFRVDFS